MTTALLFGLVIYILFRPKSYITKFINVIISIEPIVIDCNNAAVSFLSFYFADFLWCYSLSFGLCAIFNPSCRGVLRCCVIAFACGVLWEFGQKIDLFGGTADILDVLMYLLAALMCYIINTKEKQYEKD